MNRYRLLSIICLIAAVVVFALGVWSGEVEVGVIVIFPYLIGSGFIAFLGFIFLFLAIITFMFSFISQIEHIDYSEGEKFSPRESKIKGGGVVLIGPIPIVFGSNWKIAVVLMILAIIIIVISFFILRFY